MRSGGWFGAARDGEVPCQVGSIFVAKYSPAGAPVWCRCLGGRPVNVGAGRAVAVDQGGNVVVTGSFRGTVDFGGGPLTRIGGQDVFMAKYWK